MSETDRLDDAQITEGPLEPPSFDERKFLRRVRIMSTLRAVGVTLLVILVLTAATLVGAYKWWSKTSSAADRIDSYYPDLIALSHPNTTILGPSVTRWHFPTASNDYASYRLVGNRPVAAGVYGVDFDFWDAEFLRGYDERWTLMRGRAFRGSDLVPDLRFANPVSHEDTADSSIKEETGDSVRRLESTPPSYTVEVAISLNRLVSLTDLESLASSDATLAWGAVNVWDSVDAPAITPTAPGQIVGVPFVSTERGFGLVGGNTHAESETNALRVLHGIATRSRIGTAEATRSSAQYLEAHGFHYYGAVFTGSPAALLRIARDPRVTAVSYGLAVGPWE
jgi:hypothetical protein